MQRSYYENSITNFLLEDQAKILGLLTQRYSHYSLEELQRNAWIEEIEILKTQLKGISGSILFEYSIPRMGKRVDVVLLIQGIVFVLEFKIGEKYYPSYAIEQVYDYALDLKNFHEQSHKLQIVPILISTEAVILKNNIMLHDDRIFAPFLASKSSFRGIIIDIGEKYFESPLSLSAWSNSIYKPTPTIIEAAQALYSNHSVEEISRSDSGKINLSKTSMKIKEIISSSISRKRKSICFITGVPGSGKTLAGLNIANQQLDWESEQYSVFLSGNGPLVKVLQEALAKNEYLSGKSKTLKEARAKTRTFIQNIHHFRDDALRSDNPPIEKIVVFDEAQRAWTLKQTSSFMKRKKGILNFEMSEPEFLIDYMDRHQGWAVVICLVGGGQEINTGEAGLEEWFYSIERTFKNWDVYVSKEIIESELKNNSSKSIDSPFVFHSENLHLKVSVRSFRSELVSAFVDKLLNGELYEATWLYREIEETFPIYLTRSLNTAKDWLKDKARGSERFGLLASSGAYRLKPFGINVKDKIDPTHWFLDDKQDVRSSFYLEDVATEFDIQGLEIDWACVAWGADFRFNKSGWVYKNFSGSKWNNIKDSMNRRYKKNAYRVLLTRARQGLIIFVPYGDDSDKTRLNEFYTSTYEYLKNIGIRET